MGSSRQQCLVLVALVVTIMPLLYYMTSSRSSSAGFSEAGVPPAGYLTEQQCRVHIAGAVEQASTRALQQLAPPAPTTPLTAPPCPACPVEPSCECSTGTQSLVPPQPPPPTPCLCPQQPVAPVMAVTSKPAAAPAPSPAGGDSQLHPDMRKLMDAFPSLSKLHREFPIKDKFSVVMLNYKRPAHLEWQLRRLSDSAKVHQIYVHVNCEEGCVPDSVLSYIAKNSKVKLRFAERNSLNNRFLLPTDMATEWAFSIDDDIEITNAEIEWAFTVAQQHPAQITGFFPRVIAKQAGKSGWQYLIPHYSQAGAEYNVVLTGSGTFFNARWLHVYSSLMPESIRSWIDANFNCEDIAFNMMISNATGLPPVLTVGSAHTTKLVKEAADAHKGLRTRKGHSTNRGVCVTEFAKAYGGHMPLVSTSTMVVPFTFDKPALRALMKSTQLHSDPFWWPK